MMSWLVRASLRQRVLVVALAAVLTVIGVRAIPQVAWDVFPEFAPPLVEVQTEAPGLSTTEVESLISVPLDQMLEDLRAPATATRTTQGTTTKTRGPGKPRSTSSSASRWGPHHREGRRRLRGREDDRHPVVDRPLDRGLGRGVRYE